MLPKNPWFRLLILNSMYILWKTGADTPKTFDRHASSQKNRCIKDICYYPVGAENKLYLSADG